MKKRPPDNWARLAKVKIDPQEIHDFFDELNAINEAEVDVDDWFTVQAITLIRRYPKDLDRAHCILERVHCLDTLHDHEQMRSFTIQGREPGLTWVHSSIFAAIAKCPLRRINDRFQFDPDEFFTLALLERDNEVVRPQ